MTTDREPYVTVTRGLRGWFAVLLCWNSEGFYEPWVSGISSFDTEIAAYKEAAEMAEAEGVECRGLKAATKRVADLYRPLDVV